MKQGSPYFGIVTYLVFPAFLAFGALIFLVGMQRESRRRRQARRRGAARRTRPWTSTTERSASASPTRSSPASCSSSCSRSSPTTRSSSPSRSRSAAGVCHTVMEPEYTAYLASPHARVRCVDCHVGSGASWYVKSKLSGARQVLAVTFHTYPTPIPVPVKNLRPARETCEECHWPQKFYGAQLIQNPHFRYDEANTAEQISLLVKTGGGSSKLGQNAGHPLAHDHREQGHLRRARRAAAGHPVGQGRPGPTAGAASTSSSTSRVSAREARRRCRRHVMDCMDCHNRPTHIFHAARRRDRPRPGVRADLARPALDQEGGGGRAGARATPTGEAADAGIRDRDPRLLRQELPRGRAASRAATSRARCSGRRRHLRPQRLPEDEGELDHLRLQHRPPQLAGVLPLPRRQARHRGRQGAHPRVHRLPHDAAARPARRRSAPRCPPAPRTGTPGSSRASTRRCSATAATPPASGPRPTAPSATSSTPRPR